MIDSRSIAVVVPAYQEELLIRKTLSTMPTFVDAIIVVNDGSTDGTRQVIEEIAINDSRILLLNHDENKGLGKSLIDGYLKSRELGFDVTAIMAGDAQMAPNDLVRVISPIVKGKADYVKGNRLFYPGVAERMPKYRFIGNAVLTFLTKFATGYWQVVDPQCGYTAISKEALRAIPIERMIQGYGYNADILNMLNMQNMRVADVLVEPVYGEEQSKIKLRKYIPTVSWLLIRLFFRRLTQKYMLRDFNPLCLSYLVSFFFLFIFSLPLGLRILYLYFFIADEFPQTTMLCFIFTSIAGIQTLLSAIQYDMLDNKDLFVHYGFYEGSLSRFEEK